MGEALVHVKGFSMAFGGTTIIRDLSADWRLVVEGTAWKFRTGAPWRDLPEHFFENWNTIFKNFDRWAKDGTSTRVLEYVQTRAETLGDLDWVASIDSTIVRVHQHDAALPRLTGGPVELHETRPGTA